MTTRTIEGQALDIGWARDDRFDLTVDDYLLMANHKTAFYSGAVPLAVGRDRRRRHRDADRDAALVRHGDRARVPDPGRRAQPRRHARGHQEGLPQRHHRGQAHARRGARASALRRIASGCSRSSRRARPTRPCSTRRSRSCARPARSSSRTTTRASSSSTPRRARGRAAQEPGARPAAVDGRLLHQAQLVGAPVDARYAALPMRRAREPTQDVRTGGSDARSPVSDGIHWVGAIDWNLRDFHGYETPRGTTYNAYLVVGADKIALIDTVKTPFVPELLERVADVVAARQDRLHRRQPRRARPQRRPARGHGGHARTPRSSRAAGGVRGIAEYHGKRLSERLGGRRRRRRSTSAARRCSFMPMPMVHWPDSMFTYCPESRHAHAQRRVRPAPRLLGAFRR